MPAMPLRFELAVSGRAGTSGRPGILRKAFSSSGRTCMVVRRCLGLHGAMYEARILIL